MLVYAGIALVFVVIAYIAFVIGSAEPPDNFHIY